VTKLDPERHIANSSATRSPRLGPSETESVSRNENPYEHTIRAANCASPVRPPPRSGVVTCLASARLRSLYCWTQSSLALSKFGSPISQTPSRAEKRQPGGLPPWRWRGNDPARKALYRVHQRRCGATLMPAQNAQWPLTDPAVAFVRGWLGGGWPAPSSPPPSR
jgi:hypothetical protein